MKPLAHRNGCHASGLPLDGYSGCGCDGVSPFAASRRRAMFKQAADEMMRIGKFRSDALASLVGILSWSAVALAACLGDRDMLIGVTAGMLTAHAWIGAYAWTQLRRCRRVLNRVADKLNELEAT